MELSTPLEQNLLKRCVVGDLLVKSVAKNPNNRILRFRDKNYTYQEFNDIVNRCANGLSSLGIEKGDKAAILSHNCDYFLFYSWALLKIGAVMTPINWMLKDREIKDIVKHSESVFFLVEDIFIPEVMKIKDDLKGVKNFGYIKLSDAHVPDDWLNFADLCSKKYPADEPEIILNDIDPAILLYTSGTEAAPKGVILSHGGFFSTFASVPLDLQIIKGDIMLLGAPLFHIAGTFLSFAQFAMGNLVVLEYIPDMQEVLELTHEERITLWSWPTTVYMNLPNVPGFEKYDLTSLRVCGVWGALVPPALLKMWKEISPGIIYTHGWGQTELNAMGSVNVGKNFEENPESIGKPYAGLEIKIFGPDDKELPTGEVGEIVVRGKSVMTGYYKEEEKTAYALRGGWHHTGDLGKYDEEGYLYFVDRLKDMIKTGGENVSSADVETELFEHPKVCEVAVVGFPDNIWGETVTAFVTLNPDTKADEKEIIAWAKQNMAAYKVPKKIIFMDEIPKNPSGKILKKDLRKEYSDLFENNFIKTEKHLISSFKL
ncbi:MAG: AMP-binding protein [Desulfobacterales bacterium]|nr:AMP-binding protein [Desulfobacteraceae bacterium]MBT7698154.1 AMP-binding protein [Desulfobacterales bacterium]